MDPQEADRAFQEYRAVLKTQHTQADAWLCRVYRELRRRNRVLNIADAFRATGVDAKKRPVLAMMRADQKECYLTWDQGEGAVGWKFSASRWAKRKCSLAFMARHDWLGLTDGWIHHAYRCDLPPIPPRFRPPEGRLKHYWLLWEAAWESVPVDPFLLRPLGGPFYAIVGQWDLTAAERAVLDYLGHNRRGV